MSKEIFAQITLSFGETYKINFSSAHQAEGWLESLCNNPTFICVDEDKLTYRRTEHIDAVVFNVSKEELTGLRYREQAMSDLFERGLSLEEVTEIHEKLYS